MTYFKIGDVFEDERVADGNLVFDLIIHGVDVCLVDSHAFFSQ